MDLATPLSLGGDRYLEAVSVGCDPDARTVRDCPACGGHAFDDDFHPVATVLDRGAGSRARFHFCSGSCLRGWLRTFPAT